VVAYYFSSKMSRLMILMGPITSILVGVTVGSIIHMTTTQVAHALNTSPAKGKVRTDVSYRIQG
jgi:hypothetical protein